VRFDVIVTSQGFALLGVSQPTQLPNNDPPLGAAVSVTVLPLANWARHALAQLTPGGELVTVPDPFPRKVTVRAGDPALLLLVKQTTFAVMKPVTSAPDDDIPPELLFVFTVAEISAAPHAAPVTVITPAEFTVTICGVFEVHVT
jgi:fermentation-respiration switch protein FrsA (DUF1100 family)